MRWVQLLPYYSLFNKTRRTNKPGLQKTRIFLLLVLVLLSRASPGQENSEIKKWHYGILTSSSLSFAGYSGCLGGYAMGRRSLVAIGFCTSLPDLVYLRSVRPGMNLSYRFYPQGGNNKLALFMGPTIQFIRLKKYDNNTGGSSSLLSEAFYEYGMDWQFLPRWSIGNTVGFGVFYETFKYTTHPESGVVHGLNARAGIHLRFRIIH